MKALRALVSNGTATAAPTQEQIDLARNKALFQEALTAFPTDAEKNTHPLVWREGQSHQTVAAGVTQLQREIEIAGEEKVATFQYRYSPDEQALSLRVQEAGQDKQFTLTAVGHITTPDGQPIDTASPDYAFLNGAIKQLATQHKVAQELIEALPGSVEEETRSDRLGPIGRAMMRHPATQAEGQALVDLGTKLDPHHAGLNYQYTRENQLFVQPAGIEGYFVRLNGDKFGKVQDVIGDDIGQEECLELRHAVQEAVQHGRKVPPFEGEKHLIGKTLIQLTESFNLKPNEFYHIPRDSTPETAEITIGVGRHGASYIQFRQGGAIQEVAALETEHGTVVRLNHDPEALTKSNLAQAKACFTQAVEKATTARMQDVRDAFVQVTGQHRGYRESEDTITLPPVADAEQGWAIPAKPLILALGFNRHGGFFVDDYYECGGNFSLILGSDGNSLFRDGQSKNTGITGVVRASGAAFDVDTTKRMVQLSYLTEVLKPENLQQFVPQQQELPPVPPTATLPPIHGNWATTVQEDSPQSQGFAQALQQQTGSSGGKGGR